MLLLCLGGRGGVLFSKMRVYSDSDFEPLELHHYIHISENIGPESLTPVILSRYRCCVHSHNTIVFKQYFRFMCIMI